jgi:glycosyltransferase A (GT-A) superfamily protein (DUF2064 family)
VVSVAEAFISDTLTLMNQAYWSVPIIATTGSVALASQYGMWIWRETDLKRNQVKVWLQGQGDLGDRMERILRRCVQDYGAGIVLGADAPGLPYHNLANARRALMEADAVIGPSYDGGFYLLGLNACPDGLLKDLPWSQENTFDATMERLKAHGLEVAVLEHYWDIDDPLDWLALWERKKAGQLNARATSEAMDNIGEDYNFKDHG